MQRFWNKVNKLADNGCWEWTASLDTSRYGLFRVGRKLKKSHRFSWELIHGPIPDSLVICHTCDNTTCVNPEHLFIGTKADNNRDRDIKNRQVSFPGEKHYNHVLTEKDVLEIRRRYAKGFDSYATIGEDYGVTKSAICCAVTRKSWKCV